MQSYVNQQIKHGFEGNMAVYGLPRLYRIYGLKNSYYCLIISTNYFINQQMLNIKGLK